MIWSNQAKYIIHTCTLYILKEISCMQFYYFVNFIKKNVSTTLISRGSSRKLAIFTMGSYWKTLNFHVFPIFCIAALGIYRLFLCFPDNDKEHTAGLTGQQKMLTPHLTIPQTFKRSVLLCFVFVFRFKDFFKMVDCLLLSFFFTP